MRWLVRVALAGVSLGGASLAGCWVALIVLSGCAANPRFAGPLPVRNQHPAQLTVLHSDPISAIALPAGQAKLRADAAYTSLFLGGSGNGGQFLMDGEILRSSVKAEVGLGAGLQARAELAVAHTTGGFLDGFLIGWHDLFGLPDQNRDVAPRNRFFVAGERHGETVYALQERDLELVDLPISVSWTLPLDAPLALAPRVAIELPTGNADRGFGNGDLDIGFGLVGELRHGPISMTAHVDQTFVATPRSARAAGFEFADVTAGGLGLEFALTDRWSALVQTGWSTSTLRRLGFARVADPQGLLWLGTRARLGSGLAIEVAFGEDLSSYVAPDFTGYAAFVLELGGSPLSP